MVRTRWARLTTLALALVMGVMLLVGCSLGSAPVGTSGAATGPTNESGGTPGGGGSDAPHGGPSEHPGGGSVDASEPSPGANGRTPSETQAEPAVIPPADAKPVGDTDAFARTTYADGLAQPTAMAFGPDGALYVAELTGRIVVLRDANGDGVADRPTVFASGLTEPLGLTVPREDEVFVSQRGRITLLKDTDGDGAADDETQLVTNLPHGRHQNDAIVLAPDGRLYWGEGSRSDHGEGGIVPHEAAILSANLDGSDLKVVATGLRNPYGLAIDSRTGALYATDNGRDTPSKGVPDEFNLIKAGADYGWPDCWGNGGGSHCDGTLAPLALLPAHSSADGLVIYRGDNFPAVYQGSAFVALYGANSGASSIGRKVMVLFPPRSSSAGSGGGTGAAGQSAGAQWTVRTFATGFQHPLAVAVDAQGRLYVADMGRGTITRFAAAKTGGNKPSN